MSSGTEVAVASLMEAAGVLLGGSGCAFIAIGLVWLGLRRL